MGKLQRIVKNEQGEFSVQHGSHSHSVNKITEIGSLKTVVVRANRDVLDEMERLRVPIPTGANAVRLSDYNVETNFIGATEDERFMCTTYAAQFYNLSK